MTELPGAGAELNSVRRAAGSALHLELKRDAHAPARARAAVDGWCPALEGGQERRETLILLVSEVVTNAVMHSPGPTDAPIRMTARVEREKVQVAVTDPGGGFTPPDHEARPARQRLTGGGYGLYVVDQAARRWGVDEEGGTRVWFEL